ncbi:MAG: CZB domain-containing protein [Deferribacteraceae bacterium]|nr:CZB domain-containing protein [Deferribacteraceae bacterium]
MNKIFGNLAKLDHALYIHRLFNYIQPELGVKDFAKVDHNNCRLGKWYNVGMGKQEFSSTASYPKLEKPHGVVHTFANNIASLENTLINIVEKESEICNMLDKVSEARLDVFKHIDSMLEEKTSLIEAE